jgi:peroxiredoxin
MVPKHGMLLPWFSLPAANRDGEVSLGDYKPRRNLVVLLLPDVAQFKPLLDRIAARYSDYRELNAEVLVVSSNVGQDQQLPRQLPFPLLVDQQSELRRKCLGSEAPARQATALIADRWGEVHGRVRLDPEAAAAAEDELRDWVQFVDLQCEECFPPEWPAA